MDKGTLKNLFAQMKGRFQLNLGDDALIIERWVDATYNVGWELPDEEGALQATWRNFTEEDPAVDLFLEKCAEMNLG